MTARFRLTEPAIQDIEQIADYIARQSGLEQGDSEALLQSADRFLNKLDAKFAKIAQFPNLGRQRDEILPGLCSLPMDNYLIFYIYGNWTGRRNFSSCQWLPRFVSPIHRC